MYDTNMDYSKADQWILGEKRFDSHLLGKAEAVMSLGNGYVGLRSATEERYLKEKRGMFVAGTFNKFDEHEVTELPNAPDVTNIEFYLNGERFTLEQGEIKQYYRGLNLQTGELHRNVHWVSPKGVEVKLQFKRIVSMAHKNTIAQDISITPVQQDVSLQIITGIDGQITNSGAQHFSEGTKRFYDKKYMQMVQSTTQSKIDFVINTCVNFFQDSKPIHIEPQIAMERRRLVAKYNVTIPAGESISLNKVSNIYTSRDKQHEHLDLPSLQNLSLEDLKTQEKKGYPLLMAESAATWSGLVWKSIPVTIQSENPMDQLALRFAQYHLHIMAPAHDHRMNIAAKGLSGEGYKGHTFWDTEMFILPYFIFSAPSTARSLEEYRYLSLPGAHKKAKSTGHVGAQYPWESAWLDDGEVTPLMGAADIVTGKQTPILSGLIEIHITADVVFGVWQYYTATGDEDFMQKYGYEILFDTAKFWNSRLEWKEGASLYHICDVIGPDEYKEHVDNNAFTNHFVHWNIQKAIGCYDHLKEENPALLKALVEKLDLESIYKEWIDKIDKIYLPQPRPDGVIPQDDTYLDLEEIDLTPYKNQKQVGSLFNYYNLEQVNKMQVSKQADVVALLVFLGERFNHSVKRANWDYYEPRTLHDSSLSLSSHCILANDLKETSMAYQFFQRACSIDMGENMKSSDDGIHSASIGGIWQCVVLGFGGIRLLDGQLHMNPNLPKQWKQLEFYLFWQGEKLLITVTPDTLLVKNETAKKEVAFWVNEKEYTISDQISIRY